LGFGVRVRFLRGFRVSGFGFRVSEKEVRVQGLGYNAFGARYKVEGKILTIHSAGFRA